MFVKCAVGALLLLHGTVANGNNRPRVFGLVQRASNETTTTTESAHSSSVSLCTTTVTSIVGQELDPVKGSCQAVTVVSSPQIQSTTPSSVESPTKQSSFLIVSIPPASHSPTLELITFTTSIPSTTDLNPVGTKPPASSTPITIEQVAPASSTAAIPTSTAAQDGGHISSKEPTSALPECTATVISTVGQAFAPVAGICSHTVTVVTSIGGNVFQTSDGGQVITSALSTPDQKTSIEPVSNLLPTTILAPVSTTTSTPPIWISDGSSSIQVSVSTPKSELSTSPLGTTQIPVTTSSGVSQSLPQSLSPSNTFDTTQTSQPGQVLSTHTDTQSTTSISPILSPTTSPDSHPTSQGSQTVVSQVTSPTSQAVIPTSADSDPTSRTSQTTIVIPTDQTSQVTSQTSQAVNPTSTEGPPPTQTTATTSSTLPVSFSTQTQQSNSNTAPTSTPTQQSSPTLTLPTNTNTNTNSPSSPPTSFPSPTTTSYAPILYGSLTLTRDSSSNLIFGSHTLSPGSAVTISNEVISAATGGAIIINAAPTPTPSTTISTSIPPGSQAIIIVGGSTITAASNSAFIIGSQTLTPGGAITESGEVITLPFPSSTSLSPSPPSSTGPGNTLVTSTLSLGQQGPVTAILIGGQTLTAGGKVTIGGDVLSLASGTGQGQATGIVVVSTVTVMGSLPTSSKKSDAMGSLSPGRGVFVGGVLGMGVWVFWGMF